MFSEHRREFDEMTNLRIYEFVSLKFVTS